MPCLPPTQVYDGDALELSDAADLIKERKQYIRDNVGSHIITEATNIGRKADPAISLIFNDEKKLAYDTARLAAEQRAAGSK